MNKSGHLALGVLLGSAYLTLFPPVLTGNTWISSGIALAAVGIGSLAPDIDHRTSTASSMISPFSPKTRRLLKAGAIVSFLGGMLLLMLHVFQNQGWGLPILSPLLLQSYPLWLAGGLLFFFLSRIRELVLFGAGAAILYAYSMYQLDWFFAFAGGALLIIPLVRHRGVIHTPEFALCLSVGCLSFTAGGHPVVAAAVLGFVIGWWSHLIGDLFGEEGIHSLIVPRLKIALHLFRNGGIVEKGITRFSWAASIAVWTLFITRSEGWLAEIVSAWLRV
ncbi:MAG: metal-dependent hydrolase [Clostridia bacterium]